MADFSDPNPMDSQPESNNFTTDDFERVDKYDAAGAEMDDYLAQDEEVTSTSIPGEEQAEEDRYAAGASEAEQLLTDQLISFGDEPSQQPTESVPEPDFAPVLVPSIPDHSSASPPSSSTLEPTPPPTPEPSDYVKTEPPKTIVESSEEPKSEGEQPSAQAWMKNVDPRESSTEPDLSSFLELMYWRDVRKTGVVFGSMMFVLLSLAFFSVLSVVAYLSLAMLTVTLSFRVYKNVMAAVQKTGEGHPFKQYLEMDLDLKQDKVQPVVETILKHINCTAKEVRRLFLIEDLVDSIKFGLLLWVLTYVGSWFNGMTLIILAVVAIFTLPKVYETYKVQIDNYVNMAQSQLNNIIAQVQAKVPFLKKKEKAQ
ncbi:reticulon-1-A-like isoform X1 [Haliotis rufescens]|uniref:reticulon-1-A-like isoform X1 n=1 Tax=Haliotis rufescens TaxID=6454 RepID=UPI001EB03C6C|nr:reticulon-1-A-like isoform X1 [Haliotis rufescens]